MKRKCYGWLICNILLFLLAITCINSSQAMEHPDQPFPKRLHIRIYFSNQVNPEYATPETILSILNSELQKENINKSFYGEVITFDETTPTDCVRYPNVYAPSEFCKAFSSGAQIDADAYLAIFHNYPSGAGNERGVEVDDLYWDSNSKYTILLHEIAHLFIGSNHYDDTWTATSSSICNCDYKSPYLDEIMGLERIPHFMEHSREIINRNKDNVLSTPSEQIKSVNFTNIPDTINLDFPDAIATNEALLYYQDLTDILALNHTPVTLDPKKYFPVKIVNNTIQYPDINAKYTQVSPFYSPYQAVPRIVMLALLTVRMNSSLYYAWLDSSQIQMQFFKGIPAKIRFNKIADTNPPSPTPSSTPIQTPVPTINVCNKEGGDANCDSIINLTDFEIWRKEYMREISSHDSDFNRDNLVTLIDFEMWRKSFL